MGGICRDQYAPICGGCAGQEQSRPILGAVTNSRARRRCLGAATCPSHASSDPPRTVITNLAPPYELATPASAYLEEYAHLGYSKRSINIPLVRRIRYPINLDSSSTRAMAIQRRSWEISDDDGRGKEVLETAVSWRSVCPVGSPLPSAAS
jgi:hypothetical protein